MPEIRQWSPEQRIVLPPAPSGTRVIRDIPIGGPSGESSSGQASQRAMDVYRPPGDGLHPAVLFVYGDAPPDYLSGARRWGQYVSWGEAIAAAGMAAVVADHASSEARTRMDAVLEDIELAIAALSARGDSWGIDPTRLAVWAGSAGVPYGTLAAMRAGVTVRCLVAYDGPFDLQPWREETPATVPDAALAEMSPIHELESSPLQIPTLVVKAGLDQHRINASIDEFVDRARFLGSQIELVVHDGGRHAFDVLDDDERSRELIRDTIAFLSEHLNPALQSVR